MKFKYIFIDADDTLWRNEEFFRGAETEFSKILSLHAGIEEVREMLWKKQEENIPIFGYGSKTYLIGMIDTAIELCGGSITRDIYDALKKLITELSFHKLEMLEGVWDTLEALSRKYTLVLATKGDVIEQVAKVHESRVGRFFRGCEVLRLKDEKDYLSLCRKYDVAPEQMLMVGNSVRSDIIPVINIGGTAIYIPYETIWVHEMAELPVSDRLITLDSFSKLTDILL